MYQMLQYVAVCCSLRNSQNRLTKSRSLSLWLRQDKLTFILIDKSDGTSFAGDVNIFFGQAQPYNRNEHRTRMLNRGSPAECESNMSRLVMYWQCKQGWRDGVFENGTRQDMQIWSLDVTGKILFHVSPWSHAVCSQMIQQISTSSGRLRPSRRHRRSEDGFCRASMKWELVWLVVFSPVSSWFLHVCFLMFFITGFSYVIAFFWICPIFVQFIRGDGGKSAMPSQGNRSRGSATYAGWGENPLTPNQNHWQKRRNMSNICPKLDIITCQFDCTRILCDGSDGLDLSFLVTYCHLLSVIVTWLKKCCVRGLCRETPWHEALRGQDQGRTDWNGT